MNNNFNKLLKTHIKIEKEYPYSNIYLNNKNITSNNFKKPIGLYDPLGNNINPLTNAPYENFYETSEIEYKSGPLAGRKTNASYINLAYNWTNLPVYKHITEIIKSIRENQVTIIIAGTGVGKTVLVPKCVLQAFNFKKNVVCTVPKQKIASENAIYSAKCLAVPLGHEVGYYYAGKKEYNSKTKLFFTTPGSLKSIITNGETEFLTQYEAVIIDEIHERSIQTDQLLLMMKPILEHRPEFRLILMSATIDPAPFVKYFKDFSLKTIDIPGKSYEVEIFYEPQPLKDFKIEAINKIVHILKTTTSGDILVFVKSGGEGKTLCDDLQRKTKDDPMIYPFCAILDAKTSKVDSNYAINQFKYLSHPNADPSHPYTRKIVMATNVAESSITVDGIIYVIDNGYSYVDAFYPKENSNSLLEERISQAAANQRKGRAGRTTNGFCYRLYTEKEFKEFPEYPVPDIQKSDLITDILDIFLLNYIKTVADVRQFLNRLLSPPAEEFISSALSRLYALKAIDDMGPKGAITTLGKGLAQFRKINPNLAKTILASFYYNCAYEVISIILICIQIDARMDMLFEKPDIRKPKKDQDDLLRKQKRFHSPYGDFITILNIYQELNSVTRGGSDKKSFSNNGSVPSNNGSSASALARRWCKENGINARVFRNWKDFKNDSRQMHNLAQDIIEPPELIIEFFDEYKENGGRMNLNYLKRKINFNKNKIIDADQPIIEILNTNVYDPKINNKKTIQDGGALFGDGNEDEFIEVGVVKSQNRFRKRSYRMDFFPDASKNYMNSKDKNVIMAFALGNVINTAKIMNAQRGIFKTCFPEKKVETSLDRSTTLTKSNYSKIILYFDLFMIRKNSPKLNLVCKLPENIISILEKEYGNLIKTCFMKEKMTHKNNDRKQKPKHDRKIGKKQTDRKKGGKRK